jgi:hypothetical protein
MYQGPKEFFKLRTALINQGSEIKRHSKRIDRIHFLNYKLSTKTNKFTGKYSKR